MKLFTKTFFEYNLEMFLFCVDVKKAALEDVNTIQISLLLNKI